MYRLPLIDRFEKPEAVPREEIEASVQEQIKHILEEHMVHLPQDLSRYHLLQWEHKAGKLIAAHEPRLTKPKVRMLERRIGFAMHVTATLRFDNAEVEFCLLF